MGITPIPFVAGTAIVDSEVRTELDRVRNWVNTGIVAGDIDASSINPTHIYRCETQGFPKRNTECVLQQVAAASQDESERSLNAFLSVTARSRNRASIFLASLGEGEVAVVPHMAQRVVLHGFGDVEVSASWRAVSAYNFRDGGAPLHPASAGIFFLVYQKTDGPKVDIPGTRRNLNVQFRNNSGAILGAGTFNSGSEVTGLLPGAYDFWLEYRRDGANTDATQVIIVEEGFVVEVHEN